MDLHSMIRQLVEKAVSDVIAETLNSAEPVAHKAASTPDATPDAPIKRRRRRRNGPRVGYVLNVGKRGKLPAIPDDLTPQQADALAVVEKGKGKPVTAPDVEKAADMKPKSVESALYQLRAAGVIRSVALDGR